MANPNVKPMLINMDSDLFDEIEYFKRKFKFNNRTAFVKMIFLRYCRFQRAKEEKERAARMYSDENEGGTE